MRVEIRSVEGVDGRRKEEEKIGFESNNQNILFIW